MKFYNEWQLSSVTSSFLQGPLFVKRSGAPVESYAKGIAQKMEKGGLTRTLDVGAIWMGKRYRVGVIGFAHMHINELIAKFAELPQVEWVACADSRPLPPDSPTIAGTRKANLQRALERVGIPRAYDDYREMLARERFDIILFCPENARSGEVAAAIAAQGAHMMTEKPMAASLPEALAMAKAARNAGVTLATNWPITWSPAMRKAKELIDSGAIGAIRQIKWRNGASLGPLAHGSWHPGETVVEGVLTDEELSREWWYQKREGGGALLDYCCYGACIATWLLGEQALEASAMTANLASFFGDVDDNAVVALRFPGSTAILEGSWTTFHSGVPSGTVVYGSRGTLVVSSGEARLYTDRDRSAATAIFPGDPLPEGRETVAKEFIHHLETGEPLHPTLDLPVNLRAMAILDAAVRSSEDGRRVAVTDPLA